MNSSGNKCILILVICSIIYGIIFSYLNILQDRSFFSFEWEDDARENQVIYNISDSFNPEQTIHTSNYFSDHFAPIYFLGALFYKINPHIYTWYFIMSFSYGFSSIIVYMLAKHILGQEKTALVMSLGYLFYSPLHYVNLGALDANNFSLPLLFLTFYFLYKRRFVPYLLFMILSCMCKEDIPLIIFLLGLYQLIKKYPKKWWASTIVLSGSYFVIAVYIANEFLRVEGFRSEFRNYDYLDVDTLQQISSFIFLHPGEAFKFIFDWSKIRAIIIALYPLLFLPLFSLEAYIPIVMIGEMLLSKSKFFNQSSYYLAPLIPFLFIALLFSLRRIRNYFNENKVLTIALLILMVCILSNFGRNIIGCTAKESGVHEEPYADVYDKRFLDVENIFDKRLYIADEEDILAHQFINMIPRNATVSASSDLLPALSSRKIIYEFGLTHPEAIHNIHDKFYPAEYPYYNVDYIIVNKRCLINGLGGHYSFLGKTQTEKEIEKLITEHNFLLIKEKDNFIFLKKGGEQ